jgi:hypothetical protein
MAALIHTREWLARLAGALLGALAVLVIALVINVVGIRITGSVGAWSHWLHQHLVHFAVWRGVLYGATACGWWWMRRRLLRREPDAATRARLARAEIASVIAIVALEATLIAQTP